MTLHTSTSLREVRALPMSDVADFYNSKSFANYRKGIEGKQKLSIAYLERIDNVTKAVVGLGNALSKMLRRR